MNPYLIFIIFNLWAAGLFAQLFEGKITYKVEYQNNKTQSKDKRAEEEQGTVEEFYIKNGDYLIKSNGSKNEWKLYTSNTNFIYEKFRANDTIYITNAGLNNDTIHKTNFYKNHLKNDTLELKEIMFHCSSGAQYFYYSMNYKMDGSHFAKHNLNNLSSYLKKAAAIPLIQVQETHSYTIEKTFTKIESLKLEPSTFTIPKNLVQKIK